MNKFFICTKIVFHLSIGIIFIDKVNAQTVIELNFNEVFSKNNAYQNFDIGSVKLRSTISPTSPLLNCLVKNFRGGYVFKVKSPSAGFISSYEIILENLPYDTYIKFSGSKLVSVTSRNSRPRFEVSITDYEIGYQLKNDETQRKQQEIQRINIQKDNLSAQNKKLNDTVRVQSQIISSKTKQIISLKDTIAKNEVKIVKLKDKVEILEYQKDSLQNEVTNLEQYIQCQTGKNKELIDILVTQRNKLYFSNMKMINCQCEMFERRRRKGQVTLSFNLISTSAALLEDSVFIQGEREGLLVDFYMRHRNPNKTDSLKNIPYNVLLDGSPLFIKLDTKAYLLDESDFIKIKDQQKKENLEFDKDKFKGNKSAMRKAVKKAKEVRKKRVKKIKGNKSIKSSTGTYEFVVRNSQGFEVGRRSFSALGSTCRYRSLKRKEKDNLEVKILPENNRKFTSINSTFKVFETETNDKSGLFSDGDKIDIYDCDYELKNCTMVREAHLIENNNSKNINALLINHSFNFERGYTLTKHVVKGNTNGCSVTFEMSNTDSNNKVELTPSIERNPMISGFKYEIDPVTWWLCKIPEK
jgi:hypothetical protein